MSSPPSSTPIAITACVSASKQSSADPWCAVPIWRTRSARKPAGRCAELGTGARFGGAARPHFPALLDRLAGSVRPLSAAHRACPRDAPAPPLPHGLDRGNLLLVRRLLL